VLCTKRENALELCSVVKQHFYVAQKMVKKSKKNEVFKLFNSNETKLLFELFDSYESYKLFKPNPKNLEFKSYKLFI